MHLRGYKVFNMAHAINKQLLLCLTLFLGLTNSLSAQTISANDAPKYVNKVVSLTEMVYNAKYNPKSKIGFVTFPDPRVHEDCPLITIVFHKIQSSKHIHWLNSLQGKWLNVTGKITLSKGALIINGDDSHTKLSICYCTFDPQPPPPAPGPPPSDPGPLLSDTTHNN